MIRKGLWKGRSRSAVITMAITFALSGGAVRAEEGEEAENEGWNGSIALSGNAQTGTTDSFSGSFDAATDRAFNEARDEVKARFNATYGVTRDSSDTPTKKETTANSQRLDLGHKHVFNPTLFWGSNSFAERDTTQSLEVRAAADTGPGIRLWSRDPVDESHFDINFGPGYRYELYDGNTGAGVDDNGDADHFIDVVGGFEYKNQLFDDKVDFTHTGSIRMAANEPNAFLVRSEIIFSLPLTTAWSFRTGFLVEYNNDPGSDDVLNKTTTRTSLGLDYKF